MTTKTTYRCGLWAAACMVWLVCSCATTPASKDVTADIATANKAVMDAANSGDAAAMANKYTTDAKLFPANLDAIEGRKAIEEFWNGGLQMGIKKLDLQTVSAEGFGDAAIEEGRYKLYTDGDKLIDQGKYIVHWKKEDGEWKLHHDIWTTSNPAPLARAVANDSVWAIFNNVKPDKVKQFEEFNFKYLEPATAKHFPAMRNTVRTLRPVQQNADKTYTYVYLMDAATSPDGYDMMLPLKAEYGEAKAKEYLQMFTDCLKGGDQVVLSTVQSEW